MNLKHTMGAGLVLMLGIMLAHAQTREDLLNEAKNTDNVLTYGKIGRAHV